MASSLLIVTGILGVFGLTIPVIYHASRRLANGSFAAFSTIAALVAGLGLTAWSALTHYGQGIMFAGSLVVDNFSLFFAGVFMIVSLLATIASIEYIRSDPNKESYYALILLATIGMIFTAATLDLIVLYVGWELMSVSTYALTAFRKKDPLSNEAAVKYFVLSAMSSAIIIYGISITFGMTGTTNLNGMAEALAKIDPDLSLFATLAIVLFIAGFGLKMAAVPFHMWIPDAYEGAPTTVSAILAAGTKKAGFAAAIRIFLIAMIAIKINWQLAFAVVALATMTVGNVAALMQKSFTRLLAFSSIAHAGYILIGLAAPTTMGVTGALFHVLNHAIMKSAAFIAAAALATCIGVRTVDGFNGLGKRMPITAGTLTITLLALAGIPPLNGFISKLILFTAALNSGLLWLAIAGILNSAFSLGYYGWIIKRMYFDEAPEQTKVHEPSPYVVALILAAIAIVVIGVYPAPFMRFIASAVP